MKRIGKEIGRALLIGSLIFLILGVIQYLNGVTYTNGKEILIDFAYNQTYSVVLYMVNYTYIRFLIKAFNETFFKFRNLVRGILGGTAITVVCIFFLRMIGEMIVDGETWTQFIDGERPQYYYITFIISTVISLIFYAAYYYRYKQENRVKEQKIIAGTASAKFDALKNQLDPHFLFNSLNVLTSLIEENPEAATKFTTALSKVYRYVLEQKNKDLVTVSEELKFAQLYMSLIKMRFEDSIVFTYPQTISNPEAKVVPLSLQLLLENAVKHNMVTPSKKLHISIEEKGGNLVITNNIQTKQVVKESSGVGLQNITQRYQILTDRPVVINENNKQFSIAIPMLTQNTMKMKTQDNFISEKKYSYAKEQVEKLKGFYIHFSIYLIFIPVFIWLNYISGAGFPWAIFPIGGWGFGVLGHASETFNYNPFFGKNWEERKIRELMDDEK